MSSEPEPSTRRPPALVASVALGTVGGVVLVAGLVSGQEGFAVAGAGGAALSLGAALMWRSQLVDAWHGERRPGRATDRAS